jgi:peptidoglycan glycosyltransferase
MTETGMSQRTWRDYQRKLKRNAQRRHVLKRLPWLGLYAVGLSSICVIVFYAGSWIFAHLNQPVEQFVQEEPPKPQNLVRVDLPELLSRIEPNLFPILDSYVLEDQGTILTVETSIDPDLQAYIQRLLKRSMAHQAAVVALRPDSGRILALAQYSKEKGNDHENLCLTADFPAASLFKIVAAAAAIESRGYTPDTKLYFRGRKHTLYRSQLKNEEKGRYVRNTTLKKAFSGSINPVFGKIGIYDLGKDVMAEYADRFFFNRAIPFELPLSVSNVAVPEDEFGLAEIASGFNKRTLISPLHAALITAAVANNGTMMTPWLVKTIRDGSGKTLYQASPSELGKPIQERTAEELRILMADTTVAGTCRTAFRPLRRKKSFREIALGAKTGTINDRLDQYKYDWLAAYALPLNGGDGLCLTVLAIHGKKLGIRANDLARYILNYHFTS